MRRFSARLRQRRAGGERHPFAFFVIAALILLAAVFVIGLQAGRLVERRAQGGAVAPSAPPPGGRNASAPGKVDKDLDAFAEEAARVPGARPQSAGEDLAATEKSLTFRRTLAGKEPETVPLRPASAASAGTRGTGSALKPSGKTYIVQAGAFAERGTAEALKGKLTKKGISASVSKGNGPGGKMLYRVVVGPFADRAAARKAIVRLQAYVKTRAILVSG